MATRLQKIAEGASRDEEVTHAGLLWTERYNNLAVILCGWLSLSLNWVSGEGYRVTVAGVRYKARFQDREEAAVFAVGRAKDMLTKALNVLEPRATLLPQKENL
jgi:hypothetical protein